jgi:hypothetical protein
LSGNTSQKCQEFFSSCQQNKKRLVKKTLAMSSILTLTFSKENTMWQQTRSFFFLISQKQSVSRSKLFVFLLSKNIEGRTRLQVTEKGLISLLFSFLSFLGKKLFLSLLQLPVATKKVLSFFAWKQQKSQVLF